MIAGGIGTVRPQHAIKEPGVVEAGAHLIVLGYVFPVPRSFFVLFLKKTNFVIIYRGPAMLIGLGGGAASSVSSAEGSKDLDFASVQRGNAEVQRR